MQTHVKRVCRFCEEVVRGRSDKLFCDDRCRNQYHNRRQKIPTLSAAARRIQRQLIKNRRVLQEVLHHRRRCLIERDLLLRKGFSFEFFSHCRVGKGGLVVYCLDLGYRKRPGNRLEVFRPVSDVGVCL